MLSTQFTNITIIIILRFMSGEAEVAGGLLVRGFGDLLSGPSSLMTARDRSRKRSGVAVFFAGRYSSSDIESGCAGSLKLC
jgi:hypothetical protein